MFKDGPHSLAWVQEQIASGKEGVLAVAFWGDGAVQQLGLDRRKSSSALSIICNLAMGGTNPKEVEKMRSLSGVVVRQADRLHGKVYRFNDAALVGSANASANGLAFQGAEVESWHEAGLVTTDEAELIAIDHWIGGLGERDISSDDLAAAQKAWEARRRSSLRQGELAAQIMQWVREGPEAFDGRQIYLVAYEEDELSKLGTKAAKKSRIKYGRKIEYYEDWPDLPANGLIISFLLKKSGTIKRADGVFERREELQPEPLGKGSRRKLELCLRREGKRQIKPDLASWQAMLCWLRQVGFERGTAQGWHTNNRAGFVDMRRVAQSVHDGLLTLPSK